MKKIFIVGSESEFGMERSYKIALEKLQYEVEIIDFSAMVISYFPLKFLKKIGIYFEFHPAVVKANHFISKKVFKEKPFAIIVFTHVKIFPGSLEYFRSICKNVCFYWPDSIVNMTSTIFSNLKHYDNVYAHSNENVRIFERNGIPSKWLPFAGDTEFTKNYNAFESKNKEYDFSFIGAFRPERFEAINALLKNFVNSKFLLIGLGWEKQNFINQKNLVILNKMVTINEFLEQTAKSRISLNAIDHLNYPSSNLRFFEIGLSGVPQISTVVPEFEDIFKNRQNVFYYNNLEELVDQANWILSNYTKALSCAAEFRKLLDSNNNYISRAQLLVSEFK